MNIKILNEDMKRIVDFDLPWKNLEGKSILIAGANGSIPAYMIDTIMYLNGNVFTTPAKVYAVVRNRNKAEERFKAYKKIDAL